MSEANLEVKLACEAATYRPGDVVRGVVRWLGPGSPRRLEAQLVWWTEGKGDRDAQVATHRRCKRPGPNGTSPFELAVPVGPCTYHGKLISILWAVEVVAERPDGLAGTEVTVSPTGEPVTLDPSDDPDEGTGVLKRLFGDMT